MYGNIAVRSKQKMRDSKWCNGRQRERKKRERKNEEKKEGERLKERGLERARERERKREIKGVEESSSICMKTILTA